MDMKKLITDFKQFQYRRHIRKLKSKKVSNFKNITLKIGKEYKMEANVEVNETFIFVASTDPTDLKRQCYLQQIDIRTYKELPDNSIDILLIPPMDTFNFRFQNAEQRKSFILALRILLELR